MSRSRRPRRSRPSTLFSIAARKRPASSPSTASVSHAHRDLGHVADSFNKQSVVEQLRGHSGGRPRALFDDRRQPSSGTCSRCSPISLSAALRSAITATSPQRLRGAPRAGEARLAVPVHHRYRSHSAFDGDPSSGQRRGSPDPCAAPGGRRLFAGCPGERHGDRPSAIPLGVRPLVLGKLGTGHILASETCAPRHRRRGVRPRCGSRRNRRARPQRRHQHQAVQPDQKRFCVSSTSTSPGPTASWKAPASMTRARPSAQNSAREAPVEADVVVPVPDSGVPAALGFAQGSGIPFELGINPATTTSAGPSSSPRITSAISA